MVFGFRWWPSIIALTCSAFQRASSACHDSVTSRYLPLVYMFSNFLCDPTYGVVARWCSIICNADTASWIPMIPRYFAKVQKLHAALRRKPGEHRRHVRIVAQDNGTIRQFFRHCSLFPVLVVSRMIAVIDEQGDLLRKSS